MRRKNITSEMMMNYIAEALLLLMKDKNYNDITIGEITKRAGVNRSTYYRHFETKETIVRFYLDSIMAEYQTAFSNKESLAFRTYMLTMFETFYSHKDELILLHNSGLSFHLLDVLMERFHFDDISASGSDQKQFAASYHIGGIFNNMLLWFSHNMKETPQEMTDIAISYRPEESLTLFSSSARQVKFCL